jgi:hypothetical protein
MKRGGNHSFHRSLRYTSVHNFSPQYPLHSRASLHAHFFQCTLFLSPAHLFFGLLVLHLQRARSIIADIGRSLYPTRWTLLSEYSGRGPLVYSYSISRPCCILNSCTGCLSSFESIVSYSGRGCLAPPSRPHSHSQNSQYASDRPTTPHSEHGPLQRVHPWKTAPPPISWLYCQLLASVT